MYNVVLILLYSRVIQLYVYIHSFSYSVCIFHVQIHGNDMTAFCDDMFSFAAVSIAFLVGLVLIIVVSLLRFSLR